MTKVNRNTKGRQETITKRQARDKELLLEEVRKMPVVSVACERAKIGRTTCHRWIKEDQAFAGAMDDAKRQGDQLMDDMGKSQLLSLVKDKKFEAVKYYLDKYHPEFLSEKAREAREKKAAVKIIILHDNED